MGPNKKIQGYPIGRHSSCFLLVQIGIPKTLAILERKKMVAKASGLAKQKGIKDIFWIYVFMEIIEKMDYFVVMLLAMVESIELSHHFTAYM
jgi:hypothetical protein